ncbi:hypothetical protein [Streptomyces sp. NPDC014744]
MEPGTSTLARARAAAKKMAAALSGTLACTRYAALDVRTAPVRASPATP